MPLADLSMAMQKIYQTFVALAAQLQSIHENVKVCCFHVFYVFSETTTKSHFLKIQYIFRYSSFFFFFFPSVKLTALKIFVLSRRSALIEKVASVHLKSNLNYLLTGMITTDGNNLGYKMFFV